MGYFFYLSFKFDFSTGFLVTAITWSFFVLCTPIADAGFLLDLPIRLLFGIRMLYSEIMVWLLAIIINFVGISFYAEVYDHTFLTSLLKEIIINPYPFWSIIILSCIGTFLSIYFGDELLDVTQHKDCEKYHKHRFKYRLVFMAAFVLLIVWAYYYLIGQLGVDFNALL